MNLLKKSGEPALIVAAIIAALTIVGQVLNGGLTWAAATPLIVGAIVRQLVTPAPVDQGGGV